MDLRLALDSLHLLALAAGLGGVWSRARALRDVRRNPDDRRALHHAFAGTGWWTAAVVVWIVTGAWRLLGGTDEHSWFWVHSNTFFVKLALLLLAVALEIWPTQTLVGWRANRAVPNARDAGRIEAISYVQCALVVAMVVAAVSVAREGGTPVGAASSVSGPRSRGAAVEPSSAAREQLPMEPSGTETVSDGDVALLAREIAMPLDGVDPSALHSNFDERRGGGTRQHQALDIMAPRRTPIRAAATGRVLKLFTSVAGGLMIYAADSSERFIMMYAHLDGYAPELRDGAPLSRGQLIGYVGSTGNALASAPHLHFAIARSADVRRWSKGRPIDPLPVLQAATTSAR